MKNNPPPTIALMMTDEYGICSTDKYLNTKVSTGKTCTRIIIPITKIIFFISASSIKEEGELYFINPVCGGIKKSAGFPPMPF